MLPPVWAIAVVAIAIGVTLAILLTLRARAARPSQPAATTIAVDPPAAPAERDDAIPEPTSPATEPSTPIAQLVDFALPPDPSVVDSRYRMIGKLGADDLGPAFEVERLADGRRFSMRTLRRRGADRLNKFAREAQQAADIEHPNLVPVIDIGFTANDLFLVMPLVDGGSLEQVRHRFGDRAWALPLLAQIASGLDALHARGVVHRGLRPSNVLLTRGTARITDIGLAALSRKT